MISEVWRLSRRRRERTAACFACRQAMRDVNLGEGHCLTVLAVARSPLNSWLKVKTVKRDEYLHQPSGLGRQISQLRPCQSALYPAAYALPQGTWKLTNTTFLEGWPGL